MFLYAFDFNVLALGYKIYSQSSNSIMKRAMKNPSWTLPLSVTIQSVFDKCCLRFHNILNRMQKIPYNNPDMRAMEVGSATGVGTARAIAKLFCLVDSGKIINGITRDILLEPVWINTVESTMHTTLTCGWGFYHTQNPDVSKGKCTSGFPSQKCGCPLF